MWRAGTTKTRNSHKVLVGELEGKSLTAQMCEDNVEIDSKEIGWEGMDWIHLVR
jgi:hypothetical protein